MITVSIIEDHRDYAAELCSMISSQDDMVCLDVVHAPEKWNRDKSNQPDILLLDLNFNGELKGIEFIKKLKHEHNSSDIIVLTVHDEDEILLDAIKNGAVGYLVKNTLNREQIVDFIRVVKNGGAAMSMGIARKIISNIQIEPIESFTLRELDVLNHLCKGSSYRAISELLFIEISTVKFHIKNIYKKLGAVNKAQALIEAKKRKFF